MAKTFPATFCWNLMRRKAIPIKGFEDTGPLQRSLTLFHLCMYGVGAMCGGYIYGVSIVLIATKSGALSFVSNIIAGIVAALNAQCYAELSCRLPFGGGGYSFTYMICGEIIAFIIGWSMLLEYLLAFAFSSVGASNAIDVLSNHTINSAIGHYIGHLPNTYGYLTNTPNVLASVVALTVIILLGFGAKISVGINSVITISSTVILIICALFMAATSNLGRFSAFTPIVNQTIIIERKSDWLPFGVVGIIGGAALTFNAFIGFDALSLTSDNVIDPRRTVPLSTNLAIVLVFFITTFYYLCVSFYVPWFVVNPKLGLSGVFYDQHIFPMQIVAGIGEILGYVTSGFANMFALSHIVLSMSRDGLLFPFLHHVSKTFQVPIFTNIIFGLLATLMALLFDMNIIAHFMSVGTLITYTIVSVDLLVFRLINVEKIEAALPDDKVGSKFSIREISFNHCVEQRSYSFQTFTRPIFLVISIVVLIVSCAVASYMGTSYLIDMVSRISVVTVSLLFLAASVTVLFLFKYYSPQEGFIVRPVPLVPIVCIICNIILASHLDIIVWFRFGVWLILGLLCYFCYGLWYSHLNVAEEETTHLIEDNSSKTLAIDTK